MASDATSPVGYSWPSLFCFNLLLCLASVICTPFITSSCSLSPLLGLIYSPLSLLLVACSMRGFSCGPADILSWCAANWLQSVCGAACSFSIFASRCLSKFLYFSLILFRYLDGCRLRILGGLLFSSIVPMLVGNFDVASLMTSLSNSAVVPIV